MSWVGNIPCPRCEKPQTAHVEKHKNIRDWELICGGDWECGYRHGIGSYWGMTNEDQNARWSDHCKSCGWDLEGNLLKKRNGDKE